MFKYSWPFPGTVCNALSLYQPRSGLVMQRLRFSDVFVFLWFLHLRILESLVHIQEVLQTSWNVLRILLRGMESLIVHCFLITQNVGNCFVFNFSNSFQIFLFFTSCPRLLGLLQKQLVVCNSGSKKSKSHDRNDEICYGRRV